MSALTRLVTTIRALPPTPFRTDGAPQLSDALSAIVGRSFGVDTKAAPAALDQAAAGLSTEQQACIEGALRSVESIKDASALKEFPLSSTILHPRHDPHYYTRMRDGVHRSAQGIGRSWWKRFFQVRGQA